MAHSELYRKIMNSRQWRETRAAVISAHPLCQQCEKTGRYVSAQCVHHVIPIESGRTEQDCWSLALNVKNCTALCYQCHAEIHMAERSHTKESHRQREAERLERWKKRHER